MGLVSHCSKSAESPLCLKENGTAFTFADLPLDVH